jgi:hypothetical protein
MTINDRRAGSEDRVLPRHVSGGDGDSFPPSSVCSGRGNRRTRSESGHSSHGNRIVILSLGAAAALFLLFAMPPWPVDAQAANPASGNGGQETLFEQPILRGIDGSFHVPLVEHTGNVQKLFENKPFNLLLWQPNPGRNDGKLVPTGWKAGELTGFYPTGSLREHQAAFRDAAGASTVQIEGDTVGVYLNSRDLPGGSDGNKMMITPEFMPPKDRIPYPFAETGMAVVNSLELQVPVASSLNRPGNFAYVVSDLAFVDRRSHTKISYAIRLFHYALQPAPEPTLKQLYRTEVGHFDAPSHSFQVGNQLAMGSRIVTVLSGSTLFQTQPWRGWRFFDAAITRSNFVAALGALQEADASFPGSKNPADYGLIEWHLNAELTFGSGPAELGWSMRHARLMLAPESQLHH